MSTIGDRVRRKRKEARLSQGELALAAGLTQPTISALEKNKSHRTGSLGAIARALNVNAIWLETGLGKEHYDDSPSNDNEDLDVHTIPLLDVKGSCGNGKPYGDIDYTPITISANLLRKYHVPVVNVLGLYADGDSMSPYIVHGDIMFFDTSAASFKDNNIYLIDTPDGLRVKRVHKRLDGSIVLRSDNPDKTRFPDDTYSTEQAAQMDVKGRFLFRIGG